MNKRERQKEETVSDILRISEELFLKEGYENVSIQKIATACGMTKGALYHHFDSKEALMEQICVNHYELLYKASLTHLENKEADWFERLSLVLSAVRRVNEERQAFAREYFKVRKAAGGQFGERLAHYDKLFYRKVLGELIEEARRVGDASYPGSGETIVVYFYSLDRAMTDELSLLMETSKKSEFESKATENLEIFVHSISSLLGMEKRRIEELVKIPETVKFMKQMLSKKKKE